MNLKVSELMETATCAVSILADASWTPPARDNQEIIVEMFQFIHSLNTG
jgi:hypothetical protein